MTYSAAVSGQIPVDPSLPFVLRFPPHTLFLTALLLSALFPGLPACLCMFSDSHVVTDVHTSSTLPYSVPPS